MTTDITFFNKGYIAIVGNRHGVPETTLELIRRLGAYVTNLGYGISSGDAVGVDRAAWEGALTSPKYAQVGSRIYLVNFEGTRAVRAKLDSNFIDASTLTEVESTAAALVSELVPHFDKMDNPYFKSLHVRNSYQILGSDLKTPVKAIFYYSEPVGEPELEFVKGGTNTALQIAKHANVPIRVNLWGMTESTLVNTLLELEFGLSTTLEVYTIQMGKWRDLNETGITLVDVTLKSGNRAFSPDLELFRAMKAGEISNVEYTQRFNKLMITSIRSNRQEWLNLLMLGKLCLACYCDEEHFCHRFLLVDYLKELGTNVGINVVYKGEYIKPVKDVVIL